MANSSGGNNKGNSSKRIAMGGVFTALAVMFMILGGVLPFATFTAPIFAGLCLIPLIEEFSKKTSLIAYIAISLLAGLLSPNREIVLLFIFIFGYYPILQPILNKIKNKFLCSLSKFCVFNLGIIASESLFLLLFASSAMLAEFAEQALWLHLVILLIGNLAFVLYDILIGKLKIIYQWRIRKIFFR